MSKIKRAYYGSKISEHIMKTPEGFLVCHSVPISRIGEYKYMKNEIGLDGEEVISVFRDEKDVFDKKTIASFEGKAFTNTHPSEDVNTGNWPIYSKGEVSNVRRGTGDLSNCLIADIIVRDPNTIDEIFSGAKREVSAGYDCVYVEKNGKYYQTEIIGNHVALVQNGRAGKQVTIRDEEPEIVDKFKKYRTLKKVMKAIDTICKDEKCVFVSYDEAKKFCNKNKISLSEIKDDGSKYFVIVKDPPKTLIYVWNYKIGTAIGKAREYKDTKIYEHLTSEKNKMQATKEINQEIKKTIKNGFAYNVNLKKTEIV